MPAATTLIFVCCPAAGGAWAEQLINWRAYIRQWVTWPLLVLNAAVLILIGFAPLLNNWLHIPGLVLGFLWVTVFCLQDKVSAESFRTHHCRCLNCCQRAVCMLSQR